MRDCRCTTAVILKDRDFHIATSKQLATPRPDKMGKRKKSSRTPTGPKKREPLATRFKCVFCSNENSVSVQIDKKNRIASLLCNTCGQSFQCKSSMGNLMAPVDVYYEWIDACEEVAKEHAANNPEPAPYQPSRPKARAAGAATAGGAGAGVAGGDRYRDDGDGFIDDDDADAEAEYADED
ncbi:hypothetical protein EJ03DRAFT_167837 [Teratosphaeria nubilosa]|uniref:Transcription elongation factor 1 homolog n=1 Tax=Teratosphaeria nubilosa TaxID=161662 RepID=A0A6G1L2D2_9PEZI|nr:hypothetical protein EJ03DRAFT_167837 [Teratosphaeria nubilosa]